MESLGMLLRLTLEFSVGLTRKYFFGVMLFCLFCISGFTQMP